MSYYPPVGMKVVCRMLGISWTCRDCSSWARIHIMGRCLKRDPDKDQKWLFNARSSCEEFTPKCLEEVHECDLE